MAEQQSMDGADISMPLVHPFGSRDGLLLSDAKMLNCFPERSSAGMVAVKRDGLKHYCYLPGLSSSPVGQGLFSVGDAGYGVVSDYVWRLSDGNGYPLSSAGAAGQMYQFLPFPDGDGTILKNQHNLWIAYDTVSSIASDANYPTATVPGIIELDGTYYVMAAADGTIRGSMFEDVTAWDPLNFIGPNSSLGAPVALHRHLNYVVGLYSKGIQFFFNAGNATGSPLAKVDNASWLTGCASAQSIAHLEDSMIFMSQSDKRGRSIYMFQGLQMVKISDPCVDRVLNRDSLVGLTAVCIKMSGHELYVLNLPDSGVSLAYDLGYQLWMPWQSYVGGTLKEYRAAHYVSANGLDLVQDPASGLVYSVEPDYHMDQINATVTVPPYPGFGDVQIPVELVTPKKTWGTNKRKFMPSLSVVGDTQDTSVLVSYSDDDYQTFSAGRAVDMSSQQKRLHRCGSSRERAWKVVHEDNAPLRLLGLQIEVEAGPG